MVPLVPDTSPEDTVGAFAVLAVIADPKAASQRADQLRELQRTANQRHDAAAQKEKDVLKAQQALAESIKLSEAKLDDIAAGEADLAVGRQKLLDDQKAFESDYAGRKLSLEMDEIRLKEALDDLAAREEKLAAAQQKLAQEQQHHEIQVRADADLLAMLKADLETQIAEALASKKAFEAKIADLKRIAG